MIAVFLSFRAAQAKSNRYMYMIREGDMMMITKKKCKQWRNSVVILFSLSVAAYANVGYANNLAEITKISSFSITDQQVTIADNRDGSFTVDFLLPKTEQLLQNWEGVPFDTKITVTDSIGNPHELVVNGKSCNPEGNQNKFKCNAAFSLPPTQEGVIYQSYAIELLDVFGKEIKTIKRKMPMLHVDLQASESDGVKDTLVLKNLYSKNITVKVNKGKYIDVLNDGEVREISSNGEIRVNLDLKSYPEKGATSDTIKIECKVGNKILTGEIDIACNSELAAVIKQRDDLQERLDSTTPPGLSSEEKEELSKQIENLNKQIVDLQNNAAELATYAQNNATLAAEFEEYARGNATLADEYKEYAEGNKTELEKLIEYNKNHPATSANPLSEPATDSPKGKAYTVQQTSTEGIDAIEYELSGNIQDVKNNAREHNLDAAVTAIGELNNKIPTLESQNKMVDDYKLVLGAKGWFYDTQFFADKKTEAEELKTNIEKIQLLLDLELTKLETEFSLIITKIDKSAAEAEMLVFDAKLDKILTDAKNSMKELGILKDIGNNDVLNSEVFAKDISNSAAEQFKADILSIKQLIGQVKGGEEYLAAKRETQKKAQEIIPSLSQKADYTVLQSKFAEMTKAAEDAYNAKKVFLTTNYGTPAESFVPLTLNAKEAIKNEVAANNEFIAQVADFEKRIEEQRKRIKSHDYSGIPSIPSIPSIHSMLESLGTEISVLENNEETRSNKHTLQQTGWGSAFAQQKVAVIELQNYLESLEKISISRSEKNENNVSVPYVFNTRLIAIKKEAATDPLAAKKKLSGLVTDLDKALKNAEKTMTDLDISTDASGFKEDIQCISSFIGEVKGYHASLEAKENLKSEVDKAISAFAKNADFTALKTALNDAATNEAEAYKNKINDFKTKHKTLDKSFVTIDFQKIVEAKVSAANQVITNIGNWDAKAKQVEQRIKSHNFNGDTAHNEKSVSELLTKLYEDIPGLDAEIRDAITSLEITRSVPIDHEILNDKRSHIVRLVNYYDALQGISSDSVKNLTNALDSARTKASTNVAEAKREIKDLQRNMKFLRNKALIAMQKLEISQDAKVFVLGSEAFGNDVSAFDALSVNIIKVDQRLDEYIKTQKAYRDDVKDMNDVIAQYAFNRAIEIAEQIEAKSKDSGEYTVAHWLNSDLSINKLPDITDDKDNIGGKKTCIESLLGIKARFTQNGNVALNRSLASDESIAKDVKKNLKELGLCSVFGLWCDSAEVGLQKINQQQN